MSTLSRQRRFTTPEPGDDWDAIIGRFFSGEDPEAVASNLKSWNLHLFARNPPGELMGSDVVFLEPPAEGTEQETFFGIEVQVD